MLPQLKSCPISSFATSWNRLHCSSSAQSSSVFHRLLRSGVVSFSLLASLHKVLFNSAPLIRGTSRNDISWRWGDIPSLRRFTSVGASVIQAYGPAQGLFFQSFSAYGALKLQFSLRAWGTACSLMSLTHTKETCCWLRGGLFHSGCPLFSLLRSLQWGLQVPCCLPSHRVLGLTSFFPPPSSSL